MTIGTVIRYAIPTSFVYCTIYQQNIWREGDEHLFSEQRRIWADFTGALVKTINKTGITSKPLVEPISIDLQNSQASICNGVKTTWNSYTMSTFRSINCILSNPQALACRVYRKIQPYIESKPNNS